MNSALTHIERLRLKAGQPSTDTELDQIEHLSKTALPPAFRELWRAIGGCTVCARLTSGPQTGQRIAAFWPADKIIRELNDTPNPEVVPFAEDFLGNWFFLAQDASIALFDWNADRTEYVCDSFDDLLESLAVVE